MINFDRIRDNLFVGTCPTGMLDVRRLGQAGISAVVNLQSDRDFDYLGIHWPELEHLYVAMDIAVYRVPMIDFDESDIGRLLPQAVSTLNAAIEQGHRVYLHCTAGRERSPTIAVAWLHWHRGFDLDEALACMQNARPSNPYMALIRHASSLRDTG